MQPTDILQIAVNFIRALENRTSSNDFIKFYHPHIKQVEFPNSLTNATVTRNLQNLVDASEKGKKILQKEQYEIVKSYVHGNTVILELVWTATLAVPVAGKPAGEQMKAYFAQFIEFEGSKIIRQRNYDCFEPFQ
jgi:hypothetical protein